MTLQAILSRLFLFGALLPVACSDGGDDRAPLGDFDYADMLPDTDFDAGSGGAPGEDEPVCLDGETQKCSVYLPSQNGVINCFRGVQICENGQWGACGDPPAEKKVKQSDTGDSED